MIQHLSLLWETHPLFCNITFSSQFATNTFGFIVNWILHQIDHEVSSAQVDVALIRNETARFLTPPQPPKSTRLCRGTSLGLVALAAVGLFGGGLAVGGSVSFGLRGFLGIANTSQKVTLKKYNV